MIKAARGGPEHPTMKLRLLLVPLHRVLPCLLIIGLVLIGGGCSPSDQADTVPSQEVQEQVEAARGRLEASEGGRRVLRAINAHGGLEAWYTAMTSSYTWEYANIPADMQFKSYLVADNRSRRVYHDLLTAGPYGDPQPVDARFAWDGTDAWVYPDSIEKVNPRFWATSGYYFEQIPFVMADPGLHYQALPTEELNGEPHEMVQVSYDAGVGDSPGDTYTLYLDQETSRVAAIRYTVTYGRDPAPGETQRETLFYYEDYVTVDGLTVPTHFRGYSFEDGQRGDLKNEAWADSISFRRPFDASRLESLEGARVVPLPSAD